MLQNASINLDLRFARDSRRICTPEKTIERVMRLAPIMGITRLANITGLDTIGIPVYTAHRPNSRSLSVAQGKGATHASAKASALMEAVESYHAETISLPLKLNSYMELCFKEEIIDVSKISKFENTHFTPHCRILWIQGDDLLSGKKKLVPYEIVHLDYRSPLPSGNGCFIPSSNGLASGNHISEAIIHGLCEVIERDALTLWHLKPPNLQKERQVDLSSIDDDSCLEIIERFQKSQVDVGIWDITSDIGVPAFLCRILPSLSSEMSFMRPSSGMGSHLNKNIALSRALTEAAQSRLTFISGVRDDLNRQEYQSALTPAMHEKWRTVLKDQPHIRNFQSIPSLETVDLNGDLNTLLEKLKNHGLEEVIAVNLTKEEFGIPVVRIIVPGLEAALANQESILGQRASRIMTSGRSG